MFFRPSPRPQGTMWGALIVFRCIFIPITTLLDHRNTATTKKLDFKSSHLTSVGASSWPPNNDREIFENSVRMAGEKFVFHKRKIPWKTMKIGQKYVISIVFTVLRQNTYGNIQTDRAQNLVFGGHLQWDFARPSQKQGRSGTHISYQDRRVLLTSGSIY